MCKKTLSVLLFGALALFSSCVDNNYDLVNKEISTDVKLEGNKVALPVGSLKTVVLDSLIDVSEIEMLSKGSDGVYGITADSTITVEENVEPITLNIDTIQHSFDVEFDEVNVSNVHIDAVNIEPAKFTTPSISLQDLNSKLPKLKSEAHVAFNVPGLEEFLEKLKNYSSLFPDGTLNYTIDEQQVTTGEREVACNFSYKLPNEIETIKSIELGAEGSKGTLVSVVVTNPKVLDGCYKEISFKVEFPEMFTLARNEEADQAGKYDIKGSTITLDRFVTQGSETSFSFYITEISGIDKDIKDGSINVNETVKYEIYYKLGDENGADVTLTKDVQVADFAFDVEFESQLSFQDVAGKTKDIKVDFKAIEMAFSGDFDNLEYIDTIKYVEFDETKSRIKFGTHMDKDWLSVFELKEGYALKISFPDQLDISPTLSEYEGKDKEIVYNKDEHAFYIYDLGILAETHWNLALQKLTLNLPVVNDSCHMDVKAGIGFVNTRNPEETGHFYLAPIEMESLVDVLEKLEGEKMAQFTMSESDLYIKDAVVHTEVIHSSLDSDIDFSLNEKLPAEIERIEKIGFANDVEIALGLSVIGLESLDTNVDLDVKLALPSFLKLQPCDGIEGVEISDGVLGIKKNYNPSSNEPLEIKLLCTGLDFMTEEFGFKGLVPTDSIDGNSYISYNCDIVVEGDAAINGTEFHSTVLDNDISFDVDFSMGEITVKEFHGLYCAEIEGVNEKIDLDLGEGLEFLREEGNSIVLADPQLEFAVTNPMGVPVDISLHLFGTDENGAAIADTEIETMLSILPAEYDEVTGELKPVETKLFLTTDTAANSKAGYENVEIKNLANLLKKIPHSINFNVEPVIRTAGVTHHIDISEPIRLDADYSVVVPLKFNELHLCYTDSVAGLDSDMGETLEMFSNVSLAAKMDIINTIPLGLSLKVLPYDVDGKIIENIEIDELQIAAGGGEAIMDEEGVLCENLTTQNFNFAIKSTDGDISTLDKLVFVVEAASDHTTGAAALKGEQGIKLSNIVLEIAGDIEMEFEK